MKINEKIRSLRKQRDMTLDDVGKLVGVSRQTIQRYESGVISNIPYDNILLLAKAFNVHPGVLMGWDEAQAHTANASDLNKLRMSKDYHDKVTGLHQKDVAFEDYLGALYDIVERFSDSKEDYVRVLKDDKELIVTEAEYYDLQDTIEELIYATIERKSNRRKKGD